MSNEIRLAEIKARAEAATPGPWSAADEGPSDWPVYTTEGVSLCASPDDGVRGGHEPANAEFIAAAREDVPWLVEQVEWLERWKAEALRMLDGALTEVGRLTAERDALAAKVARLAEPGDPGARMDAYYYGFTRTGVGIVDDILSAVAKAGKSYHGTDMWGEELSEGGTCESRIQDAADAAAEHLRAALDGPTGQETDRG